MNGSLRSSQLLLKLSVMPTHNLMETVRLNLSYFGSFTMWKVKICDAA